jgi:hypothetical protein
MISIINLGGIELTGLDEYLEILKARELTYFS